MAILSMFSTLGACALGVCARRTTLKSEPLHLADGCLIINRDVTGWLFCSVLGWYSLLSMRCLHASPLTMALHVVEVYVMGACSRHVWAVEVIGEGEGARGRRAKRF
jgi:hypothetical protein